MRRRVGLDDGVIPATPTVRTSASLPRASAGVAVEPLVVWRTDVFCPVLIVPARGLTSRTVGRSVIPERAQRVGRVVVARTEVHLGADSLCRPRWVRYAVAVPEHVVAYRIEVGWGLPVTGTPVEGDAWEAAARTYLDEVSGALEELYRAHGGRTVRLDLVAEERRWRELSYPLSWPGWQRRWARRSKRTQREFVERIGRAAQVYGPVRAEVARRYEEVHAEREAEKRALAEAEELRRQERVRREAPFRQVADGCSWTYRGHFRVSRVDVPSSDEAETYRCTPSKPLSTSSLEFVVRSEYFRNGQGGWIEWDPAACAAVERECAALGRPVTFAQWWDTVTVYDWTTDEFGGRLRSRVGHHRRDSGDHRAFGGYGGDYGTAGHDAGGHSGGFGTSF
jgi:hypothetical protein